MRERSGYLTSLGFQPIHIDNIDFVLRAKCLLCFYQRAIY